MSSFLASGMRPKRQRLRAHRDNKVTKLSLFYQFEGERIADSGCRLSTPVVVIMEKLGLNTIHLQSSPREPITGLPLWLAVGTRNDE